MNMLESLGRYLESGFSFSSGMMPETGPKNIGVLSRPGYEVRSWGMRSYEVGPRVNGASGLSSAKHSNIRLGDGTMLSGHAGYGINPKTATFQQKAFANAMPIAGLAMSGYFIYQGYQENGARGAFDAGVLDVSASAGIARFGYTRKTVDGMTSTRMGRAWTPFGKSAMAGMLGVGMGAYAGASVGQEYLGTAGAVAGGFAGAGLTRAVMSSKLNAVIGVGALLLGGAAKMVGEGAYDIVKTGYRNSQARKGYNTAGDTAAFFTRQAVTMRQRAMQAIHKSHTNARSALGQEATFMHQPERNYFSTYRKIGNMI